MAGNAAVHEGDASGGEEEVTQIMWHAADGSEGKAKEHGHHAFFIADVVVKFFAELVQRGVVCQGLGFERRHMERRLWFCLHCLFEIQERIGLAVMSGG